MAQTIPMPLPYQSPFMTRRIPEGDDRERDLCGLCGHIFYDNPKPIVGAVCTFEGRYLLCRRGIAPQKGFWAVPGGFMELGETSEQGAVREVWEEACARIRIDALLALYNLPQIGHVHLVYRAELIGPEYGVGPESEEVALFDWDDIPWEHLAYPHVAWSLHHHRSLIGHKDFAPRGIPSEPMQEPSAFKAAAECPAP